MDVKHVDAATYVERVAGRSRGREDWRRSGWLTAAFWARRAEFCVSAEAYSPAEADDSWHYGCEGRK